MLIFASCRGFSLLGRFFLLFGWLCVISSARVCFLVAPVARVISAIAYFNASRTTYFRATCKYVIFCLFLCNSGCLKINSKNPPCPVDEHLNASGQQIGDKCRKNTFVFLLYR